MFGRKPPARADSLPTNQLYLKTSGKLSEFIDNYRLRAPTELQRVRLPACRYLFNAAESALRPRRFVLVFVCTVVKRDRLGRPREDAEVFFHLIEIC